MPWRNASPMDQRTQFIADYLRDSLAITELCEHYGLSRKTGYKWIERYLRHGPAGLRSRRPRRSPNQTAEEIDGDPRRPAPPSLLGRQETPGAASQAPSPVAPPRALHRVRHPEPPRDGAYPTPAAPHRASGQADESDPGA